MPRRMTKIQRECCAELFRDLVLCAERANLQFEHQEHNNRPFLVIMAGKYRKPFQVCSRLWVEAMKANMDISDILYTNHVEYYDPDLERHVIWLSPNMRNGITYEDLPPEVAKLVLSGEPVGTPKADLPPTHLDADGAFATAKGIVAALVDARLQEALGVVQQAAQQGQFSVEFDLPASKHYNLPIQYDIRGQVVQRLNDLGFTVSSLTSSPNPLVIRWLKDETSPAGGR